MASTSLQQPSTSSSAFQTSTTMNLNVNYIFNSPSASSNTRPISDPSVPAPKRISKACCHCRRDKIKCNGERPCSGCVRKGLAPDKCIDGCVPCRRSRARCDGGNPCSRCMEMKFNCSEDDSPAIALPSKITTNTTRAKTSERAALACFACRRDNKKCDNKRPCSRCISRSEECIHVARGPKIVKLRCKGCREENRKCEDQRPCRYCIEAGEECSDIPRKGRGHGMRVKAACIYCRRDKIQCDAARPCRSCQRRGFDCEDRSCSCAEKGPGHDCVICRARADGSTSQRGGEGMEGRQYSSSEPSEPMSANSVGQHYAFGHSNQQHPSPLPSLAQALRDLPTQSNELPDLATIQAISVMAANSMNRLPSISVHNANGGMPMPDFSLPAGPPFLPGYRSLVSAGVGGLGPYHGSAGPPPMAMSMPFPHQPPPLGPAALSSAQGPEHRPPQSYYPVIDPNIDSISSSSTTNGS